MYWIPNCWKLLAAKRAAPQAIPPVHRSRRLYGVADEAFFEGSNEESGITESVPADELFPERFTREDLANELYMVEIGMR